MDWTVLGLWANFGLGALVAGIQGVRWIYQNLYIPYKEDREYKSNLRLLDQVGWFNYLHLFGLCCVRILELGDKRTEIIGVLEANNVLLFSSDRIVWSIDSRAWEYLKSKAAQKYKNT